MANSAQFLVMQLQIAWTTITCCSLITSKIAAIDRSLSARLYLQTMLKYEHIILRELVNCSSWETGKHWKTVQPMILAWNLFRIIYMTLLLIQSQFQLSLRQIGAQTWKIFFRRKATKSSVNIILLCACKIYKRWNTFFGFWTLYRWISDISTKKHKIYKGWV